MPYIDFPMPEYPCREDMWDKLKAETRPIMVYGMGNGADKLFSRFEKYGIAPKEIFASDGFVRGHSFRGMKVKSFSEIKQEYRDFVIVVSFASSRPEVLDIFGSIDKEYDVYFPDMPVAGEEYFDREFYNNNYKEMLSSLDALFDEESKACFRAVISYKLTGKLKYLMSAYSERNGCYGLLDKNTVGEIVDVGAYNGDTLREALSAFPELRSAICIEPDPRNFKKLKAYAETLTDIDVKAVNAAAWCENGEGVFSSSGNRNSTITATVSHQHKDVTLKRVRVDFLTSCADLVKYDVEGAEREALAGTSSLIEAKRPTLLVSLYHRSADIFELTNYIRRKYPFYRLYLRRTLCVPAWEIDLIAVSN